MNSVPKIASTARPSRGFLVALIVMGLCLGGSFALMIWQDQQRQQDIADLAGISRANEDVVEDLCAEQPNDPACKRAEGIPSTTDIVDEAEIQEPEIDDPEIQDPEVQDPERQDPETQNSEQQDAETQERERQDPDPDDPDPNDPDPNDPEIQDPEVDDPDPNSLLEFDVADNCTPPTGEVVIDVGLQVSRGNGVVTYTITCQTGPA